MKFTRIEKELLEIVIKDVDMSDQKIAARLKVSEQEVKDIRNKAGKKLVGHIGKRHKHVFC